MQFARSINLDRRQWVTVAKLAALSGVAKRTIQRQCQEGKLHFRNITPPNGGKPVMEIDLTFAPEEYRLAFAHGKEAQAHSVSILKLTQNQRRKAAEVISIIGEVDAYVAEHRGTGKREKDLISECLDARRISKPSTPSIRTYYRMRDRWFAGGKSLASVADMRAVPGKGVKAEFDEDAFNFFCSMFLVQNGLSAAVCYRALEAKARQEGWAIPSLDTVVRTVKNRVPLSKQIELREGPEARKNKVDSYIERDWSQMRSNEFWVSDHCQFDIIALDDLPGHETNADGSLKPARMWSTGWMDEGSRFIVGVRVHRGPNSREVMASLHDAISEHGIPENIRIDNGKDYRCDRFAGGRRWHKIVEEIKLDETAVRPVLYDLQVTPHFSEVHNARAKIIEPWHKHFVKEQFSRIMPGFCGGSPDERPEQLADIVAKGGLMRWSELVRLYNEAIQSYNMKSHETLGTCPAIARQQKMAGSLRMADPRTLSMLFQERRQVTIGRNGIVIDRRSYGLGNPDVIEHQGERVDVRFDHYKAGVIYVYEPNGRYLCTAHNNRLVNANATPEDLRAAKKLIRRANQMRDELAENQPILSAIDPGEQIALLNAHARQQMQDAGGLADEPPAAFKPIEWHGNANQLPFQPVRPSPDGSKVLRTHDEKAAADSTEKDVLHVLPTNIFDAYSAG